MRNKTLELLALAAVACTCLLGCDRTPKKHEYLVVLQTQTDPNGGSKTTQIITSGTKFTATDVNWVRTNTMAGNTNMAVIVLNIVKLDD